MALRENITREEMEEDMREFVLQVQGYLDEVVMGARPLPYGAVFSIAEMATDTEGHVETWFAGADFAVKAALDHLDDEVAADYAEPKT